MASKRIANYQVDTSNKNALVLRDMGPWSMFPTITNSAEEVVDELTKTGQLKPGQRLFYWDSLGDRTEIILKGGQFHAFAPGAER